LRAGESWQATVKVIWPASPRGMASFKPDPIHDPTWIVRIRAKRQLPLCCIEPAVTIVDSDGHQRAFLATPPARYGLDGRYRTIVSFPRAGTWRYFFDDRDHGNCVRLGTVEVAQ